MTKVYNRKPTEEERRKLLILSGMESAEYSIYISEPPLREPDFQYEGDLYGFIVENKLIELHKLMVFGLNEEEVYERLKRIEEPMKRDMEKLKQERPELFEDDYIFKL